MSGWLAIARLTWPLYLLGIRRPYGWASGKYAAELMRRQVRPRQNETPP